MINNESKYLKGFLGLVFILIIGCTNKELEKENTVLEAQLKIINEELRNCSLELTQIKDTPEQRFLRARKFISENDTINALNELKGIVNAFSTTNEANEAQSEIIKIEKDVEERRKEEERKKALGFKILKPVSLVKYDNLTVRFEKVWRGNRWAFDDHGNEYSFRDAKRGNSFILAKISIISEITNPSLPPVLVYKMKDGELILLDKMEYEFRRWEDYGSYLGNHADYGNDFSHSKTIPFNLGVELSNDDLVNGEIYVAIQNMGCFVREVGRFSRPPVKYKSLNCGTKSTLKINDFDKDYELVKIL